jgi:hypothetical protein
LLSLDDDSLSVQEAADTCGVTYRTLPTMVRRGELPAVCRSCLVQAECLCYALSDGTMPGIFGGATPQERRRLALPTPSVMPGTHRRLRRWTANRPSPGGNDSSPWTEEIE